MAKKAILKTVEVKKGNKTKVVHIRHHHRKPYRKLHLGTLLLFAVLAAGLILFGLVYREKIIIGAENAKEFVSGIFGNNDEQASSIRSTYGFSLSYDTKKYYGSAIDAANGNLYLSGELSVARPYQTIKLSTISSNQNEAESTFMLNYDVDGKLSSNLSEQLDQTEKAVVEEGLNLKSSTLKKVSSSEMKIDDVTFRQSDWNLTPNSSIVSKLSASYTTYIGVVNDKIMTIKVYSGIVGLPEIKPFSDVLQSIKFGLNIQTFIPKTNKVREQVSYNQKLIQTLTFAGMARAASAKPEFNISEKNTAIYSPAVVKIYNIYCLDINIKGKRYLKDVCDAYTGSGFFVGSDGYIATNGHVASVKAKDLVIYHAIYMLAKGDTRYVDYLASLALLDENDLLGISDPKVLMAKVIEEFYSIPNSYFTTPNSVVNLMVGLNESVPDYKTLVQLTTKRKNFSETADIKNASLVAADFRLIDGINGFKQSDVALIKINKNDLPVTKLGSIDGLTQGVTLSILGFPSSAGDNGLVNSSQSKVTLTTGKVSAIKDASGSSNKLIETDATIGGGNSGGPALNETGEVVGLATYTVDQSGTGGGVFNYIRDIKDLKDLAAKSSITFNASSQTQTEWDKGINYFYNSRYSKAIKSFNKVKGLYPEHSKVAEFTKAAQAKIDAGQDVKDFPIIPVAIGAVIIIAGIVVTSVFMVRHRKAHELYKEHFGTDVPQAGRQNSSTAIDNKPNDFQPSGQENPGVTISGFQTGPSANNPFIHPSEDGGQAVYTPGPVIPPPAKQSQSVEPEVHETPKIIIDHTASVDGIKRAEASGPRPADPSDSHS